MYENLPSSHEYGAHNEHEQTNKHTLACSPANAADKIAP